MENSGGRSNRMDRNDDRFRGGPRSSGREDMRDERSRFNDYNMDREGYSDRDQDYSMNRGRDYDRSFDRNFSTGSISRDEYNYEDQEYGTRRFSGRGDLDQSFNEDRGSIPSQYSDRSYRSTGYNDMGGPRGESRYNEDRQREEYAPLSNRSQSSGMYAGKGPKGYKRSDERIKEDVSEALARHPRIDASEVEVSVKEGEVILTGTVSEREMKRLAEDAIEHLFGVKEVTNQIRVQKESGQQKTSSMGTKRSGSSLQS